MMTSNINEIESVETPPQSLKVSKSIKYKGISKDDKIDSYEAYIDGFEGALKAERELTLRYKFKYEQLLKILSHDVIIGI